MHNESTMMTRFMARSDTGTQTGTTFHHMFRQAGQKLVRTGKRLLRGGGCEVKEHRAQRHMFHKDIKTTCTRATPLQPSEADEVKCEERSSSALDRLAKCVRHRAPLGNNEQSKAGWWILIELTQVRVLSTPFLVRPGYDTEFFWFWNRILYSSRIGVVGDLHRAS